MQRAVAVDLGPSLATPPRRAESLASIGGGLAGRTLGKYGGAMSTEMSAPHVPVFHRPRAWARLLALACASCVAAISTVARAEAVPASPFTDHAVLQQGPSTPVFGTANPGETVKVSLGTNTVEAVADATGHWLVRLPNLTAGGPFELRINTLTLTDVYVGEVWLCSGQSNMDFTVAKTKTHGFAGVNNEAAELAAANYPLVRMFTGQWAKTYEPQARVAGEWKLTTPENAKDFSAVGYFFARDLHKALNVPVGIINMSFGASTAEAWMRREAVESVPELVPRLTAFDWAVKEWPEKLKALATQPTTRARRAPGDPTQDQHNPTVLYNGMIAPIIPYGIKGFLWYQGESVVGGAEGIKSYGAVQAKLITDWRKLWGDDSLPFYNVQLAALQNRSNNPDIRAQQATILNLPHTGMAVTIDIGDPKNVHPKDKQDVGDRLCRIALANAYGKDIEFSGPVVKAVSAADGKLRLTFTHAAKLVAKGADTGELKTFEVAGEDGTFVPASATIDGDAVVVSSPTVPTPKWVRYAWNQWPEGANLYNDAALPAAPFKVAAGG